MELLAGLKGRGGAGGELDPPTAIMTVVVAAMLADGRVDPQEEVQIDAICTTSPIFRRNSAVEIQSLITRATRLLEEHGEEEMCRRAAEALSPGLRETAFAFAAKVVYADGDVGELERALIGRLTDQLRVGSERAERLIEAVAVMQHRLDA